MHTHQKDNSFKEEIIKFSNENPENEVCGLVCYKNEKIYFEKVKNQSNDPDMFLIHPMDFLNKKINKELLAVFHSHVNAKEEPSEYDIKNAKNCLCPFLIYSTVSEKFSLFDMPNFERDEKGVIKLKEAIND
tara:strand:+ start:2212 stop:2607 length:396 start_codon:yes stop_codon:yes gene_type:complete